MASAQGVSLSQLPHKVNDLYGRTVPKPEKRQPTPQELAQKKKEAEEAAAQAEADDVGLGLVCDALSQGESAGWALQEGSTIFPCVSFCRRTTRSTISTSHPRTRPSSRERGSSSTLTLWSSPPLWQLFLRPRCPTPSRFRSKMSSRTSLTSRHVGPGRVWGKSFNHLEAHVNSLVREDWTADRFVTRFWSSLHAAVTVS